MAAADGNGTTVTFATSSMAFLLTGVDRSGQGHEDLETTTLSTTSQRTYIASALKEGGEVTLQVHHDPSVAITYGTAENITIDWAGAGSNQDQFQGYVKDYQAGARNGEVMSGTVVIKVSGAYAA